MPESFVLSYESLIVDRNHIPFKNKYRRKIVSCKILAICDSESSYADLLTKQLLRVPGNRLEIRNFTDIEKLKSFAKNKDITYLVLSEKFKEDVGEIEALSYYFLTEEKESTNRKIKDLGSQVYIFRYQSAQEIYNIICPSDEMFDEITGSNLDHISKKKTKFIGVYQPVHRNGNTTVAKAISSIMRARGSVLYINLEEYPGALVKELDMDAIEPGEGNLGDLFYYLKQSDELAKSKLPLLVHKMKRYHALAPIGVSQELRQIPWTQWEGLIELLKQSSYTTVVLDIHSCVQGYIDLLDHCDVIYGPEIMGRECKEKSKSFEQEMKLLGKNQILIKMETLTLPEFESPIEAKVEEKLRSMIGGA